MNALSSLIALVVLMFAGYYYVTVIATKPPAPPPTARAVEEEDATLKDWWNGAFESREDRERQVEARALAKLKQIEAVEKSRRVVKLHDQLLGESRPFSKEVSKLLKDVRGKRIAANEALVREFEEVTAELPSADDIRFLRMKLDVLLEPLKKALPNKRSLYLPDEEFLTTLWELEAEISGGLAQYVERRKKLESIISRADGDVAETTLAEVLKIRAKGGR